MLSDPETIAGAWRLDPARCTIAFRVRMLGGLMAVNGRFEECEGRLDLAADPAIELAIEVAGLRTGNRRRDRHLRSADFFDADNHPRVRFVSQVVEVHGEGLAVRGRLAARGETIPLTVDARVRAVDGELAIEAAATAEHRALGMTYSPLGMISPRSELSVAGRLVRADT